VVAELFIKTQKVPVDLVVEEQVQDNLLFKQDLLDVLTLEAVVAENILVHLDTQEDLVSLS
jgi:hypothetical protein